MAKRWYAVLPFLVAIAWNGAAPADPPPPVIVAPPGYKPPPPGPLNPVALDALKSALAQGDYTRLAPFFDRRTVTELGHLNPSHRQFIRESYDYGIGGFMAKLRSLHDTLGSADDVACSPSGNPAMTVICYSNYIDKHGRSGVMIFGENNHLYLARISYVLISK